LPIVGIDQIDRGRDVTAQIRVLGIGTRIDDRHFDTFAPRPEMSARDVHLFEAALQAHIRVVVLFGARCKTLQRLRQPDASILRQCRQQGVAIRAFRNFEHGTVHVQWFDRPCVHFAQSVVVFHRAHLPARGHARSVARDGVVAVRRAAGSSHKSNGVIVDSGDDEVLR
jgi:hypothetical protein